MPWPAKQPPANWGRRNGDADAEAAADGGRRAMQHPPRREQARQELFREGKQRVLRPANPFDEPRRHSQLHRRRENAARSRRKNHMSLAESGRLRGNRGGIQVANRLWPPGLRNWNRRSGDCFRHCRNRWKTPIKLRQGREFSSCLIQTSMKSIMWRPAKRCG